MCCLRACSTINSVSAVHAECYAERVSQCWLNLCTDTWVTETLPICSPNFSRDSGATFCCFQLGLFGAPYDPMSSLCLWDSRFTFTPPAIATITTRLCRFWSHHPFLSLRQKLLWQQADQVSPDYSLNSNTFQHLLWEDVDRRHTVYFYCSAFWVCPMICYHLQAWAWLSREFISASCVGDIIHPPLKAQDDR